MPKTRPPYSPEFRRQVVELARAGRDPAGLAREFEPSFIAKRSVCEAAVGGATAGAKARRACLSYIEGVSNPVRLHSALSCRSPIIYEQEQTQTAQAEP